MIQGLGELFSVDLNPLAAKVDKSFLRGQQFAPFGFGKRLVPQSHLHLEVEHALRVEFLLPLLADGHAHARTRTLSPPVGHADEDAAFLEDRHVLKKLVSLPRRPCQRLINVARLDQLLDQEALLRSEVNGRKEFNQRFPCLLSRPTVLTPC